MRPLLAALAVSFLLALLGGLSGREFFDAVVPLEKIEAVLVRVK